MALGRDTNILLGFYRNDETAREAIRALREAHFVRSAILSRDANGKVSSQDNDVMPREAALLGVAVGLFLALLFFLAAKPLHEILDDRGINVDAIYNSTMHPLFLALFPLIGAASGYVIAKLLDYGVSGRLLRHNALWVTREETLVVIQAPSAKIARAHEILRTTGNQGPTVFVARPDRAHRIDRAAEPEKFELLAGERLQIRAKKQAEAQRVSKIAVSHHSHDSLLRRLRDTQRTVQTVESSLVQAGNLEQSVSISAEWLLDNAYVVQSQIKDVRQNLTTGFYRELPVVAQGRDAGTPRIYALASDLIANTDARLDRENMTSYLRAYQEIEPLKLSELWAMPLMLRMALIEKLRFLTIRIDERQAERERADFWANRLLAAASRDASQILPLLTQLTKENPDVSRHFADRLVSQLYDEESALSGVRTWLEAKFDRTLPDIMQAEGRRQAADQVAIANIITSLRQLLDLDWREIFEDTSLVHQVLNGDPAQVYGAMDFATRDRYRHAVESAARKKRANKGSPGDGWAEIEAARAAIDLALGAPDHDGAHRKHIGFYLVDDGISELLARLEISMPRRLAFSRWLFAHAAGVYIGGVALITALVLAKFIAEAREAETAWGLIAALCVAGIFVASEWASQLWDYVLTRVLPPRGLAKMSFENGIPEAWKTLVVVPMMLSDAEELGEDLERLEVRHIANPGTQFKFALLADFTDAAEPHTPHDEELLGAAISGIEKLNERHGADTFFLFHRQRQWCASEGKWIGWERKRGKLEELNHFLTHTVNTAPGEHLETTILRVGSAAVLRGVAFVITLDADTQLPHDSARKLVETLAHPLNRPHISPDGKRVDRGYTIIQPRVSTALPSAISTRFTRLFTDARGTDPYTHLVSNVYQDLSGEGAYHGKGIYDLHAFSTVLQNRFPTDTLLSHDLIEGSFVRVGLATDIELFDQFPSNYLTFAKRDHRWIRGDWQIAPWLKKRVPTHGDATEANVLSGLNKWKIFDNLRRSLVPIFTLAFLVGAWIFAPQTAKYASALVGGLYLLPVALTFVSWLTGRPLKNPFPARDLRNTFGRSLLNIALLPQRASLSVDAVGRVLYRRFVSRKNLLEWTTASAAARGAGNQQTRFFQRMLWSSAFAIAVGAPLVFAHYISTGINIAMNSDGTLSPAAQVIAFIQPLLWALPFLALWFLAPFWIKWLAGGAPRANSTVLSASDKLYVRGVARETWRYFEDFIGPQTNWLPPDNFQEYLNVELAPRTSPTNIGLWYLSALAARDFGYITPDQCIERTAATTESLENLERYEGHFLNWYDIFSTQPLNPRYVSTVDSGNLLVSFWAFAGGVREITSQPVLGPASLEGLADTLALLKAKTENLSPNAQGKIATLERLFAEPPARLDAIMTRLRAAGEPAYALTRIVRETSRAETSLDPAIYWADALEKQVAAWNAIIDRYLLWAFHLLEQSEEALQPLGEAAIAARRQALQNSPSLEQIAHGEIAAVGTFAALQAGAGALPENLAAWLEKFNEETSRARWLAGEMLAQAETLVEKTDKLSDEMGLGFLYDTKRKLFHIGFNVTDRRLDNSYYDLIASECRLASFAAIARGEVPAEHWLKLRRLYLDNGGEAALMSWSGTMFEYLMPLLLTHQYPNSLLDYGCRTAVEVQQKYGRNLGVPWGISEAAFSALDAGRTYQYHAFGVPGLGLKRGLEDDIVVAPYATALALQVDALGSIENLKRLEKIGMRGAYGFYESIDYTRQRVPEGERGVIVRNFMVHHQGMSLVSFANVLHGGIMRERFHADPRVQAAAPLLYESVPNSPPVLDTSSRERRTEKLEPLEAATSVESFGTPDTPTPRVNLLSNGNFSLAVTNAGGGYARWKDFDITRWRGDTTRDDWGQFVYVRDLDDKAFWSIAFQPTMRADKRYNATFSPDKATFRRRDNEIETFTEIIVAAEDDIEIRRVTLLNHSKRPRRIELTSYNELALAPHAADRAHPAFSKLFIQTEAIEEKRALVAWRRPRSPKDEAIWAAHGIVAEGATLDYETDRARFIGRGRSNADPVALEQNLTQTDGAVLDPIFSLRHSVRIAPGERVEVYFLLAAGDSKSTVLTAIEKYSDTNSIARAFDLAWTNAQLEMHRLRVAPEDVSYFQQLAGHMMYPAATLRASARRIRANTKQQRALWAYGISGDLPILLVTVGNARDVRVVKQLLQAHTFWRVRGLKCDLVILDEDAASYEQSLSNELKRLVQSNTQYTGVEVPGGVFLRGAGQIPEDDLTLLKTVARVSLLAARGNLAQQLGAISSSVKMPPRLVPGRRLGEEPSAPLPFMELPYFNGLGGFTEDGREYAIYLGPNAVTPAPWCNVMANENFGALVSESGPGFCWSGNSQMNRITPWSNDPVSDPANDAIYIRDDETGTFWTPTPLPIREDDAYRTRHGQGYSVYEHNSHAIEQELTVFVPCDENGGAPLRVQRLKLRNGSSRKRRLSILSFNALTLGTTNEETITNIVTSWDENERVLLARNAYHPAFGHKVAFFTASPTPASFSGDRWEFLGRNGTAAKPAALGRAALSNRSGAALDPCAALQSTVEIGVGEEIEIIFIAGQADSPEEALRLAREWREPDCADAGLAATRAFWDKILDSLVVETPDKSVNFLLNRWLVYQDLSCRIWGRSAFYQSGGAFGFRDQLQDTMAMVYAKPDEARAQILRASAHQFVEGDVQHWWHPPLGAGVRTKFSDDLLWLPLVTAHYVRTTGDVSVLHEEVEFIEGKILGEDEHESYMEPTVSSQRGTVLEHCRRSIKKGLTSGPHGLPLIGIGDWNDGMSRVGVEGKGESVWLAWFIIVVLRDFAELLEASTKEVTLDAVESSSEMVESGSEASQSTVEIDRTHQDKALQDEIDWCESEALKLAATVEREAWDGEYYIRAYFDNGEPLGSHICEEAKIDSLPQSWAILSGAADLQRAEQGMAAVEKHLVREEDEMILLFTPPFDKSAQDPGYIKGYVPGVRENGGQYTHAAIWVAQATARKGDGKRAVELMRLLNPVEHARTLEDVAKYQVEPYVITADVYALEGRVGRGGWSWYTGSASWFYRVWIEEILGFHLRGERLFIEPHIPADWPEFTVRYRHENARYHIRVENKGSAEVTSISVDEQAIEIGEGIKMESSGEHHVVIQL